MAIFSVITEFLDKYPYLYFALRIILAGICGFAIGLERYVNNKSAGVRTHVVVCCASALFMLVSIYGFEGIDGLIGVRGADPSRIAAQVVTGISFLGAGMIFKEGDTIKGLTTAAGVWSTAAIGLAIGAGMYFISIFVTAFLIVFMIIVSKSGLVGGRDTAVDYKINMTVAKGKQFHSVINEKALQLNSQITKMHISKNSDDTVTYDFTLHTPGNIDSNELLVFIEEHSEIIDISADVK